MYSTSNAFQWTQVRFFYETDLLIDSVFECWVRLRQSIGKKTNLFHKMKKIYLKKEFKKIIKKILPFYQSQK